MRVGFVTGEYPPMQGGVGAFTREVARAMVSQGHTVCVFTRSGATGADESGIRVFAPVVGGWQWAINRLVESWASQNNLDVVNIQFQTAAYDMHPAIHWLPGCLKKTPVVVTFHDLRVPYLFPKAGPIRQWVVRKLARDAAGVIATDRGDEITLREAWGIRNVRWIPIGSNVSAKQPAHYNRQARRAALGIGPHDLLISYFGFLNQSKGGLVLLTALKRLVEQGIPAHLILIGGREGASDPSNAEYAAQFDAFIRQHRLAETIHWTGFVDDAEVSACFYDSDITALPYLDGASLRRGTLMAALAHGRAIVTTTPQSEAPELTGVVETVPPEDSHALADAILRLWHEPSRRHELEKAASQASRQFEWDGIARNTTAFFDELLSR